MQAKATATITDGKVTGLTISDPGDGYTSAPVIRIAPPEEPETDLELAIVRRQKVQDILDAVVKKELENIDFKKNLDICLEYAVSLGFDISEFERDQAYDNMIPYIQSQLELRDTEIDRLREELYGQG